MPSGNNNRRFGEIILGLLLLVGGLSAVGSSSVATILLIVVGLFMLSRQLERTASSRRESDETREYRRPSRASEDEVMPAQPRADQVYAHALEAVQRAGLDPAETHVLPIDIGVMTFSSDHEPAIYRTRPVLDDVDYIQPFVQLRLPTRARGRIRFEILDSDGQVLFIHEEDHEFQRGRNLVTPAARLPIHDAHAMQGDWQLRVSADGVLIAEHDFAWEESTTKVIRRHIAEDGELSSEMRAMMAESRLQRISLDDLLAEQDTEAEEPPPRQVQRR